MRHKINVCVTRRTARQVSLCFDCVAVGRPIRHFAFVLEYDSGQEHMVLQVLANPGQVLDEVNSKDRKSTRLNSSHGYISYAVFCLKNKTRPPTPARRLAPS